jgi:hypothetical protein
MKHLFFSIILGIGLFSCKSQQTGNNIISGIPLMEESDVFRLTVRYEREGRQAEQSTIVQTVAQATGIKYADEIVAMIRINPHVTALEMAKESSNFDKIVYLCATNYIIYMNGELEINKIVYTAPGMVLGEKSNNK